LNSILALFTSYEKSIRVRGFLGYNENPKFFRKYFNTKAIAPLLPDFVDDYGEDKNLDFKIYFSKA